MPNFTNQATLSYNNTSVSSNIIRSEFAHSLTVEKIALSPTYCTNDKVTFAVSIRNSSTVSNTYCLSDDLGAYTFNHCTLVPLTYVDETVHLFINGILQPAPAVYSTSPLEISGITVPAGGNALVLYSAFVNRCAPVYHDDSIVNTVSVTSDGPACATAQACICPIAEPRLSIEKELSPCRLTDCAEPVSYTFTITNIGPAPALATDNAVIFDTFDPVLNISSVAFNGVTWSDGMHYTYDETTGEFSTIPGQITVPAADYSQDPDTGEWVASPGVSTLTIYGNY